MKKEFFEGNVSVARKVKIEASLSSHSCKACGAPIKSASVESNGKLYHYGCWLTGNREDRGPLADQEKRVEAAVKKLPAP